MRIVIERGIPLPYIRGTYRHVWEVMQNGDSFTVPDDRLRRIVLMAGKRAGHQVTSDKLNGSGYRVWLVEKRTIAK